MSFIVKSLALFSLAALVGCGGGGYKQAGRTASSAAVKPSASGPISRACLSSDRKARSPQLCGCIQAVADLTLSSSEQSRAATFYNDPQKAQDIRQSDNSAHERFWQRYKEYGKTAQDICG